MQACQFKLTVTDGREYFVFIAFDNNSSVQTSVPIGQNYVTTLVQRADDKGKSIKPTLFINRHNNDGDSDIWLWLGAISYQKDDLIIKNETLQKYQTDSNGKFTTIGGDAPAGLFIKPVPTAVITLNSQNMPEFALSDQLSKPKEGDRVRLYYACPTKDQTSQDGCVVYKYDLYQ
jgi:hypothetical protein